MLDKIADLYNRQDMVDLYKYGVFNYINYFDLLSRFKISEYKTHHLQIIKRRSYIIKENKSIKYKIDNKLHRDGDKPAIEYADGRKDWYQNGKFWCKNGKLHRDNDKPAVEYADGAKFWYQNGKLHRSNDKPAIEYANGTKEWYQNDVFIRWSQI